MMLICKRLLWTIPILWMVATITFALVRVVPGGPFDAEKHLPPEIVANIPLVLESVYLESWNLLYA